MVRGLDGGVSRPSARSSATRPGGSVGSSNARPYGLARREIDAIGQRRPGWVGSCARDRRRRLLFAYCASWAGGDEAIAQIKISAQCIQRTAKAILDSLAMITTGTP